MKTFLLLLIYVHVSQQFLNTSTTEKNNCAIKIFNSFNESITMIIYNNTFNIENLLTYNSSKIIYNTLNILEDIQRINHIDVFLLLLLNKEELESIYKSLYNFRLWNENVKFIISFIEDVNLEEIFELSWKFYIINNVVIIEETEQIFTYFPYNKSKNCGMNHVSYLLANNCNFMNINNLFPSKVPSNLNGCAIKMRAHFTPPLVINISSLDMTPKPKLVGVEATIMRTIAIKMNFTDEYIDAPRAEYLGLKLPNGSFTDGLGRMQRKEIDIFYGYATARLTYSDFDSLYTHFIDIASICLPFPAQTAEWQNCFKVFQPSVHALKYGSFLLIAIIWRLMAQYFVEDTRFRSFSLCCFNSWYIINQGSFAVPKSTYIRIVYFLWCVLSLVLYAASTSKLISFLTSTLYDPPFRNVDDVLESELKIGVYSDHFTTYFSNDTYIGRKMADKSILCPIFMDCFKALMNGTICMWCDKSGIRHLINLGLRLTEQNSIYYLQNFQFMELLRFYMSKGYPLQSKMDKLILQMHASGLTTKWTNDVDYAPKGLTVSPDPIKLSLSHTQTAFYSLIIGLCISFIVFVLEMLLQFNHM